MIVLKTLTRTNYCSPTEWIGTTSIGSEVRIAYEGYYFTVLVNNAKIDVRQLEKQYLEDLTYSEVIDLTKHLFDYSNVEEEQFSELYHKNIDFCIKKRELVDRPFDDLIKKPNCDLFCIEKNIKCNCGCNLCAKKNGYFHKGEIFVRRRLPVDHVEYISDEDFKLIKDLFDDEKGYLREGGCCLSRKSRSEICLRYLCDQAIRYMMKEELSKEKVSE